MNDSRSNSVGDERSGLKSASKLSSNRGLGECHGTIGHEVACRYPQGSLSQCRAGWPNGQDSQLKHAIESERRSWKLRKQRVMLVAVVLVVSSWMVFVSWRSPRTASVHRKDLASPYQNTRPEVKYLGDSACVRCHAQSCPYVQPAPDGRCPRTHHGRDLPRWKGDEGGGQTLFEPCQGLNVLHRTSGTGTFFTRRRDATARAGLSPRTKAEVRFVVGSGRQGSSYLVQHDGFLFESPLTWYSRTQAAMGSIPWFLKAFQLSLRPADPAELSVLPREQGRSPVPGPINQYRSPIFQGHAIGCERCHGPGELHVARPTMIDGKDMTIVNPAVDLDTSRSGTMSVHSAILLAIPGLCGVGWALQ